LKQITVAVAGQPNVGKSTLFNVLTGSRVLVANWPGVTVEKHEGFTEYKGYRIRFVDLPGVYGLSALTLEERISRSYILSGEADVLVALVDSTIPERTLYLPVQFLEMFKKVVIAYTKYDLAHELGLHVNLDHLEKRLGVPVVAVSARTGYGVSFLLDKIIEVTERGGRGDYLRVDYGELEPFINSIESKLSSCGSLSGYPLRWLSVRLLEGDAELASVVEEKCGSGIYKEVEEIRGEARRVVGSDLAAVASSKRFAFITSITRDSIVRLKLPQPTRSGSVFYNPLVGSALSILILLSIFMLAFIINTGFPLNVILSALGYQELAEAVEALSLSNLMSSALEWLQELARSHIESPVLASFISDGVIGGVASVLTFLPLIFIVVLIFSIVEDAGLLPRMAVGVSTLTSRIGLSGNVLFPITISMGCNVPGIFGARASLTSGERLRQILTLPLIPCQARLVVLLALATALKTLGGWLMVLLGYLTAFTFFAVLNYLLYKLSKDKEPVPEMLLEIPALHKPLGKVVWWMTWNNVKHFITKAGTIIFASSIIIWALVSLTPGLTYSEDASSSIAASLSRFLAPALYPFQITGGRAWIIVFGLLMGFIAKEVFISSVITVSGSPSFTEAISSIGLSDSQIVALGVFITLYMPCLATISAIYSETRSVKLTLLSIVLSIAVAYAASTAIYYLILVL